MEEIVLPPSSLISLAHLNHYIPRVSLQNSLFGSYMEVSDQATRARNYEDTEQGSVRIGVGAVEGSSLASG